MKIICSLFVFILFNFSVVFASSAVDEYNLVPVVENMSNQEFQEALNHRMKEMGVSTKMMPFEVDIFYKDRDFLTYRARTINGGYMGIFRKGNSIYRVSVVFPNNDNMAKEESYHMILAAVDVAGLDNDEARRIFKLNKKHAAEVWCKINLRFYHSYMMMDGDLVLLSIMAHR